MGRLGPGGGRHHPRAIAALVHVQHVGGHVLADHVPRRRPEPAHAAQLQPLALAQGEIEHAGVLAQHLAGGRADLAGPGRQVAAEELAEVALADEADPGRILLRGRRQPGLVGHCSHVGLLQFTEREGGGRQLLLAQLVQEIALVLARVARPQQPPAAAFAVDAGVVAGGNALGTQLARRVQEVLELDLAVAQHVRVGGAAGGVLGQEVLEHVLPVLAGEIAEMDRDAEPAGHRHRVAAVVLGAAVAAAVVGPVLHEQAGQRLAGVAQEQGGDRGVDAARQADDGAWGSHAARLSRPRPGG